MKLSKTYYNTIKLFCKSSIEGLLEDSPSLKPLLSKVFEDCYQKARLKASEETGIKLNFFPKESPFSLEETLESRLFNE